MKKIALSCALLAGLAACQTTDNVVRTTNVSLLSLQKPELAVGDTYSYYLNGKHETTTVTAVGADTFSFEVTEGPGAGCTFEGAGFVSPDVKWENCESSTGSQTLEHTGDIWPLKVGNTESYAIEGTDGTDTWSSNRECSVAGIAMVTLGTTTIPTYEVVCKDKSNTRTWFYSQTHKWPVKYTKVSKKRGLVETRELDLGQKVG
ncbi:MULTISPECIES: hypothetical protein [Thalassospira]|uniref:Lipoprotein n=2 Tax=Thalassospira TaxID=168934 RepID=A0A367WD09_9PROT|nr:MULTISPECIES: hypothetical protein [Thalassospira]MDG4717372.1 hypothetical protein [Thalassospira sp. FZY0004]RCK39149.1 hypothetical protein TH19_05050 [Thalassospira profundimaris]